MKEKTPIYRKIIKDIQDKVEDGTYRSETSERKGIMQAISGRTRYAESSSFTIKASRTSGTGEGKRDICKRKRKKAVLLSKR